MIRRRHPRHAFAMALMLIVLMVLTVTTVTLVGTGVRDQQSARLSAGRGEARLLATSVLEDFFARLKEDPTGLYDLLASQAGDSLSGSVFAGYNTAWRRDNQPTKWAVLPSVGRVSQTATTGAVGTTSCAVDDFTQDCFYVEIPPLERLGPDNAPGSFLLRVNLRLRCGGVESRCIYSSFEQRVRRVQFYDFVLANEFSTLDPRALFPQGSYTNPGNINHKNHTTYADYINKCVRRASLRDRTSSFEVFTGVANAGATDSDAAFAWDGVVPGLEFTGCVDVSYTADSTNTPVRRDTFGPRAAIYSKDDWISVCGSPDLSSVFLSGSGLPSTPTSPAWSNTVTGFSVPANCGEPSLPSIRELNVPAMSLPSGSDVLAATGVSSPTALTSGTPLVIDLSDKSGLIVYRGDGIPSTLDAVIYGNVTGNVSVVVQGSVAIIGNIEYANRTADHVLSLTASERIEIWQSCFGEENSTQPDPAQFASWWNPQRACVPSAPFDRVVDGVLTSPDGYIGVPDWLTNTDYSTADCAAGASPCRDQGTLNFYGSMTSKFQGVFGSFTAAEDTTELVSGFFKKFEHDDRLTRRTNGDQDPNLNLTLPPYLVESSTPVWVRLDLSEVAYQGS
jgi:hypothetical protein